ncbi:MAG TPA: PAS domain S-box protein, partial [Thermoanaerobaculia bacterium]|nr:PAS domain S-box protein [Thermoanaerobaculia bacterium]
MKQPADRTLAAAPPSLEGRLSGALEGLLALLGDAPGAEVVPIEKALRICLDACESDCGAIYRLGPDGAFRVEAAIPAGRDASGSPFVAGASLPTLGLEGFVVPFRAGGWGEGRLVVAPAADVEEEPLLALGAALGRSLGRALSFLHDLDRSSDQGPYRTTQLEVARILSEGATITESAPGLLSAIGEGIGWDVGSIWSVDRSANVLRCEAVWSREAKDVGEFAADVRALAIPPNVGIQGRVWSRGEPVVTSDLAADTDLRGAGAIPNGLRSGGAVPLRAGSETLGVLVFFTRTLRRMDAELTATMAELGSQIGHFVERKRAEESLLEYQRTIERILDSSPAVIYTLRVGVDALEPVWVSTNFLERFGHTPEESLAPLWWLEHVHPEDREHALEKRAALLLDGTCLREYRFLCKDGRYRWIRDESRLVRDAAGEPQEVVGSWSDVTSLKEAERSLFESEEQYRLLFQKNPHPMWVFDEGTLAIVAVNEVALRHYGFSQDEFLGMTLRDLRPAEDVSALEAHLVVSRDASGGSAGVWRHRRKNGSVIEVEIEWSPIAFRGRKARLVLAHDVTNRRSLEAQLLQSQKMDSVGRLAGGIAHDFNNLLLVITGYGNLLLGLLPEEPTARGYLDEVLKAADRAASLTGQLLAFSRKQVLQPKVIDLNQLVLDMG